MEIIPAIDIIDGKCVRLTKGDYSTKKEYSTNHVDVARMFEDHGFSKLHLVDLDGAKMKKKNSTNGGTIAKYSLYLLMQHLFMRQ